MKKKILSRIQAYLGLFMMLFMTSFGALLTMNPVFAEGEASSTGKKCGGVDTAVLQCNAADAKEGIFSVLGMVLNIFTLGIGAAATVGFIWCGYLYMTSKNEPAVIMKVKTRIFHIVIGLVVYAMFWGVANFLLPGGIYAGR